MAHWRNAFILGQLRLLMRVLNLCIILFLGGVSAVTIEYICRTGSAKAFLETIPTLTDPPGQMLAYALWGYFLLLTASWLAQHTSNAFLCYAAEIAFCFFVVFILRMSDKSVVLIVIADLLLYLDNWTRRTVMLLLMTCLYVLADPSLFGMWLPQATFEVYLSVYPTAQANLLLSIRNMMTSASVIVFVLFVVALVREQSRETSRIQRLNRELEQANQQLREMTREREHMAETRERNRLAREIHDTLGHALTGISVGLDACLALLDVSPQAARQQLEIVSRTARQGLQDVRASVSALRPDAAPRPLRAALRDLANQTAAASGAQITMEIDDSPVLRPEEDNAILRVVQESMTNALRHGHADRIEVSLRVDSAQGLLRIRVHDNGQGCPVVVPNFGLRHMQERLELLGGTIHFDGQNGFTVLAELPLRKEETE